MKMPFWPSSKPDLPTVAELTKDCDYEIDVCGKEGKVAGPALFVM